MKSKNLKLIVAVEAVLLVCLCLGVAAGVFYYLGGQALTAGGSQPPAQPVAEATATLFPAVVETPTETPTPGPRGSLLEQQPDGMLKYTDYDAGFELILPVGWLAARPGNAEEFNALKATAGAKNEMLVDQMDMDMTGYEVDFDRLYSYPVRPDLQKDVIFGFSKLGWDPKDSSPINNSNLGEFVRNLEASGGIPGFRATTSNIVKNTNNVAVVVVKGRFAVDDGQGGKTPFFATILFFKPSPTSTARMTFTILQDFDEQISPDIEMLIESIKLLGQ